jgi:6-pyruvoyltetrahydropterin/6-carboxytetrahydropterin synthase
VFVVGTPTGLEPAASRATILRSNQLSYGVRERAERIEPAGDGQPDAGRPAGSAAGGGPSITAMLTLTRRFTFSASHRLRSARLDAAGNAAAFGMCEQIHGHNFVLEVSVAGQPDPATGFFCNVLELERTVRELAVAPCDHRYLNELPMFAGVVPTMETVAQVFWNLLQPALGARGMRLVGLRFAETDEHWVRIDDR